MISLPTNSATRVFALIVFLIVPKVFVRLEVEAVRFQEGCYDAHPVSCNQEVVPLDEILFDVEEVCTHIEMALFYSISMVIHEPSTHVPYLNGLPSSDDMCPLIQQAYSHCSFCGGLDANGKKGGNSEAYQMHCLEDSIVTGCGNKPTLSEVLQDNEQYSQFKAKQDIDETCAQLNKVYNISDLAYGYPQNYPKTIDLCDKQHLVKHLCPGFCAGGCFDFERYPPTCNGAQTQAADLDRPDGNATVTANEVCHHMRWQVFGTLDNEAVLDPSTHMGYLQEVSEDDILCPLYREAYSQCAWCQGPGALCFDQSKPASCEAPDVVALDFDDDDTERVCLEIFRRLPYFNREPGDLSDISWQSEHLFIPENTTLCHEARQVYHKCAWCDKDARELPCLADACSEDFEVPEFVISGIKATLNITADPTEEDCDEKLFPYWLYNVSSPVTTETCYTNLGIKKLCPKTFCQMPEVETIDKHDYLGTTTTAQRKALIWASRSSAILSFLGASFILYSILSETGAQMSVYHGLLVGMAVFDIVTAFAWGFATTPIDRAEADGIEGAIGSHATCTAQAFFIQLGFTSVFYNVSLAIYYVLVIAHGWKEFQLKKIHVYLHVVPVTIGLGLACGAIPFYAVLGYGCHLLPPPDGVFWQSLLFVVLPLGLSIVAIVGSMVVVYCRVRQKTAATRKWSFGIGQASKMEQAVFRQCLFYAAAFLVTWPILFGVYLVSVDAEGPFGLAMTVAFVAPLQGFNNFLVFLRGKLKNRGNRPSEVNDSSLVLMMRSIVQQITGRSVVASQSAVDPSSALAVQTGATPVSVNDDGAAVEYPKEIAEDVEATESTHMDP